MSGGFFPDVNVLLSLTLERHMQYRSANRWYEQEGRPALQMCRVTQLGFLRLLTTQAMAGFETRTNDEALILLHGLVANRNVALLQEPRSGLDALLLAKGGFGKPAPKRWVDAYLSSFAVTAGVRLVTFDVALATLTPGSVLLRPEPASGQ